jgi:hypothetical protein
MVYLSDEAYLLVADRRPTEDRLSIEPLFVIAGHRPTKLHFHQHIIDEMKEDALMQLCECNESNDRRPTIL